ncbi:YukJ family protein [Paenibacillus sp. LK1]|uniref:YukJ family protein n=1 Tax=Paenibacillus sp. LK1 TaxID=2053014 RepID=UPI000C17C6F9|nr:YukJ family protein [Paenibacillus sp. LK1]PIH55417.1 hypothetical protein CS562_31695 [Paenibacillus sp. LK1]
MSKYGVLIGNVVNLRKDNPVNDNDPHYNVTVEIDNQKKYDLPINVQSKDPNLPKLLYYSNPNYNAQAITILPNMEFGFHEIDYHHNVNADIAVDYIRSGLFNPNEMKILPVTISGERNDLYDFIDEYMNKALNNDDAVIYAYGTHFPGRGKGVHNVHMNQGNTEFSRQENGTYHDGCFLIHFKNENKWVAYFLAFQSQSWCTENNGEARQGSVDENGHPTGACKFDTINVTLQIEEPDPVI